MSSLLIVMPIYNEEESILYTLNEWYDELIKQNYFKTYNFLLINDGSTDNTLEIIRNLNKINNIIEVIDKENSGHGQSCLIGYNYAFQNSFEYVLQLDSDGQCDPKYFKYFIKALSQSDVVYGIRYYRKDGIIRFWVSRILSVVAFFITGIWSWDPNVPYRLFKVQTLNNFLKLKTESITLLNVVLALYHVKYKVVLVPIVFRERHGGSPSVNTFGLYKQGVLFQKQLKELVQKNDL